jgi:hypothetical protein
MTALTEYGAISRQTAITIGSVGGHLPEVMTSAEYRASRRNDDDSRGCVIGRLVELKLKRAHHAFG